MKKQAMTLKDFLTSPERLISGTDSGNITNKITYVNEEGNIDSINISSVIGIDAKPNPATLNESKAKVGSFPEEMKLHVQITSDALKKENAFYTVGEYSHLTDIADEIVETKGQAEDKLGNEIHIVTTLTGLALAAWKSNKNDTVEVPLSFGLPIEEAKSAKEEDLNIFIGNHKIKAIDGPYKGREVTLNITSAKLNIEGITSFMALEFDLVNGEIVDTDIEVAVGEEFGIGDLGAGTLDIALFDEDGLNPHKSTNHELGTNEYIDQILKDVVMMDAFKEQREMADTADLEYIIYKSREEFMRKVVKPEISKLLENKNYTPQYMVKWLGKTVDITEVFNKHAKHYYDKALKIITNFIVRQNLDNMLVVGGGVLFTYQFMKEKRANIILAPKVEESSFFTSKAYLIKNVIAEAEKHDIAG